MMRTALSLRFPTSIGARVETGRWFRHEVASQDHEVASQDKAPRGSSIQGLIGMSGGGVLR